jgi:hypothetical protein
LVMPEVMVATIGVDGTEHRLIGEGSVLHMCPELTKWLRVDPVR